MPNGEAEQVLSGVPSQRPQRPLGVIEIVDLATGARLRFDPEVGTEIVERGGLSDKELDYTLQRVRENFAFERLNRLRTPHEILQGILAERSQGPTVTIGDTGPRTRHVGGPIIPREGTSNEEVSRRRRERRELLRRGGTRP